MSFYTLFLFVENRKYDQSRTVQVLFSLICYFHVGNVGVGLVASRPEISSVHFSLRILRSVIDIAVYVTFVVIQTPTLSDRHLGLKNQCFQKWDKNAKIIRKRA